MPRQSKYNKEENVAPKKIRLRNLLDLNKFLNEYSKFLTYSLTVISSSLSIFITS